MIWPACHQQQCQLSSAFSRIILGTGSANERQRYTVTASLFGWAHTQNEPGLKVNKANLRDLIAATGLVILLKLESNRRFFSPCDLEIWWMTPKNNRAPLLHYIKLCASFQIHQWIPTGVTVRKHSVWVKIDDFLSHVTLKFDGWSWKTIGHLFNTTASFLHHFISIDEFKLELQSGSAQFG